MILVQGGIELAPEAVSWRNALEARGVRVRAVPNWIARLAYRCGAAALYLEHGMARTCVGLEAPLAAWRALPGTTVAP